MKRAPLALTLLLLACQTAAPPELKIAPDTPQRLAQLPRTVIDYDRSLLTDDEKQVVAKLIEASKAIDELYWRQVSEENPELRAKLEKLAPQSALHRAAYQYFLANKGPWDRLKENEPFVGTKKKPEGAAFYPEDTTKDEIEKYLAAHPEAKD